MLRFPYPTQTYFPPVLGGVSGTWLPRPMCCAPALDWLEFILGLLDVGGAVGGPRKLGCLIPRPLACGCVVALRSNGDAELMAASEGLPSLDGSGMSADEFDLPCEIGDEARYGDGDDRSGVDERERDFGE